MKVMRRTKKQLRTEQATKPPWITKEEILTERAKLKDSGRRVPKLFDVSCACGNVLVVTIDQLQSRNATPCPFCETINIRRVTKNDVYEGPLAEDVQKVRPDAVYTGADGFLRVRYDLLGIKMRRVTGDGSSN
jgi:hypothetical protein